MAISDFEDTQVKNISAEDFAKLDFSMVTLLDLRETDEVLVSGIEGAINIPFSQVSKRLDDVPKDLPVYVFCRTGDWSEEIAEILEDRGYDAYNLVGGYKAYIRLVACQMSMEIMGIKQEELIDGVELGGVATFLRSGEQSNMSLFI